MVGKIQMKPEKKFQNQFELKAVSVFMIDIAIRPNRSSVCTYPHKARTSRSQDRALSSATKSAWLSVYNSEYVLPVLYIPDRFQIQVPVAMPRERERCRVSAGSLVNIRVATVVSPACENPGAIAQTAPIRFDQALI